MHIPCRSSPRPGRLHVIDTLRGVQVGGDPSRAERRRGHWSHGSPSAPTSAGRAGKSFLRKPREMSRRTAAAALSTDGAWAGGARRVGRSGECEGRGNGRGRRSEAPKNGGERHHTPAALISAPAVELARARITVPRAKRLLRVAAAVVSVSVMSSPRSRSTLMRQPAPSSAWKSWLRRPIARPTCQTPLRNSRSFRALPALHEQLCAQRPPCLARWYRRFRRSKVRRPQRSTWAAR